jgi:hypothetical protein
LEVLRVEPGSHKPETVPDVENGWSKSKIVCVWGRTVGWWGSRRPGVRQSRPKTKIVGSRSLARSQTGVQSGIRGWTAGEEAGSQQGEGNRCLVFLLLMNCLTIFYFSKIAVCTFWKNLYSIEFA